MKKALATLILGFTLGLVGLAIGGLISKPFTFSSGTLIKSSDMNSNFDTIMNEFNGNISDANIATSAAIQQSKIVNLTTDLAARLLDTGDTITGELKSKYSTPCHRFTGSEASAKDWQICESAGSTIFQENTGTEGTPTWTTRYTLAAGAGGPATGTDLSTKTYVDGLTKSLAFGKVVKTDGDVSLSTSYATVAGLSPSITTGAHRVKITFIGSFKSADNQTHNGGITLLIDTVDVGGSAGMIKTSWASGNTTRYANASFTFVSEVLTAASHTFEIQVKDESGGTSVLKASDLPAVLIAEELPY